MAKRRGNGDGDGGSSGPVRLSAAWRDVARSTREAARLMVSDDAHVQGISAWLLATHLRVYHLDDPSTAGVDWHEIAEQLLSQANNEVTGG